MNQLLQLRKTFENLPHGPAIVNLKMPALGNVNTDKILKLMRDGEAVREYWENKRELDNIFVSVHYNSVIAKSNRIRGLLEGDQKKNMESVVGAKFSDVGFHIITHYISREVMDVTLANLKKCQQVLIDEYGGYFDNQGLKEIKRENFKEVFENGITKELFLRIMIDCCYVDSLAVEVFDENAPDTSLVTLYHTGVEINVLLRKFGVDDFNEMNSIDALTVNLSKKQLSILKQNAPFLIAMALDDISRVSPIEWEDVEMPTPGIPEPTNEPVIGVIDTLFDTQAYFARWVEARDELSPYGIPVETEDFFHGTSVTSIIVDGPALNPRLDDGCGRFRVRHFGVSKATKFNSFSVIRDIKKIVENNPDIKVWNLSLGAMSEVNYNFISPEAAILDQIQYDNDVIFIIAGTNKKEEDKQKRIGAPADSLNGIVVNSVDFNDEVAKYSRKGPVLHYFNKPDVSYYGGVKNNPVFVNNGWQNKKGYGTSYAAPWITRKVAFLIHVMGMTREVAKALIVDSAAGWNEEIKSNLITKGYGVVPIRIEKILESENDEIRFFVNGIAEKYTTKNFELPIPEINGKQPFYARATMCYFPKCNRNQGVDYTNTEMDLQFGKVKKDNSLATINDNRQDESDDKTTEKDARALYRKWDNVKRVCERWKKRKVGKTVIGAGLWGMKVTKKERLAKKDGKKIRFGLVVTLKEMNGKNRQQDFIDACRFRAWLVDRIDVNTSLDIYRDAEESIDFEE